MPLKSFVFSEFMRILSGIAARIDNGEEIGRRCGGDASDL